MLAAQEQKWSQHSLGKKKIMNVRKSKFAILMVLPIRFIFDILSEHTREMKA